MFAKLIALPEGRKTNFNLGEEKIKVKKVSR